MTRQNKDLLRSKKTRKKFQLHSLGANFNSNMNKNLLLVEDDLEIRTTFIDLLIPLEFIIHEASNGIEALEIFKKNKIDHIISDIDMPIMNGLELFKKIREINQRTNIIIVSGNIAYNERDILANGANHFILKPIADFDFLYSLLKQCNNN